MARLERDEFRVLHHVPGQILVSLRRDGVLDGTPDFDDHRRLLQATNELLEGQPTKLEVGDLKYLGRGVPAMRFSTKETTTEVHSFRFEEDIFRFEDDDPARMVPEASRVPEIVLALNRQLRAGRGRVAGLGTIRSATPNWLSASSQGWGTGGGPGLPPEPVPPQQPLPRTDFSFDSKPLGEALKAEPDREHPVVVAVLDTSPNPDAARRAAERYKAKAGNELLERVVKKTIFQDGPLQSGTLPEFAHLVPFWANRTDRWQPTSDPANREKFFNIVDHGLFVAGVVQSIAPDAEVHLYRVLDDVGVGDLGALLAALDSLPGTFLQRQPRPRLIVNLSLLIEEFAPKNQLAGLQAEELYASLFDAIESLRDQGVLIVAAAGNDSLDLTTGRAQRRRRDPRLPARHDQVLSVAAVDQYGKPSTYSNRSDSNAVQNGIAIFGGNASLDQATGEPEITDPEHPVDLPPIGIVGVYSHDTLPFEKGANETGLVYWAGTSFAAPVISGLAARRWSLQGAPSLPADVIANLVTFASAPIAALGCGVIKARQ